VARNIFTEKTAENNPGGIAVKMQRNVPFFTKWTVNWTVLDKK